MERSVGAMLDIDELDIEIDDWTTKHLYDRRELNERAKKRGELATMPVVLYKPNNGTTKLKAFWLAFNYQRTVAKAMKIAIERTRQSTNVLLSYDGFYTTSDTPRTDALFYRAYLERYDEWLVFIQRYIPKSEDQPYSRIGNMLFIGTEPIESGVLN